MSRFRRRPFLGVFGPAIHHQSLRVLQLVHLWKTEPDIRRWKWPKLSPILPVITVSIPFHSPVPPSGNCGISGRKGSSMEAGPCITYKKKKELNQWTNDPPPPVESTCCMPVRSHVPTWDYSNKSDKVETSDAFWRAYLYLKNKKQKNLSLYHLISGMVPCSCCYFV